jgi:hypothetical protein
MSLFSVYEQVKNDPACAIFFRDQHYNPQTFFRYLTEVPFQKISVRKISASEGVQVTEFPVVDRFSETYRKSIIAKFCQLEEWYEDKLPAITFVTLTARNTPDKEHFFKRLFHMRHLFFNHFTKLKKDYVWVVEPHLTSKLLDRVPRASYGSNRGYPHIHGFIFDSVSDHDQDKLKKWWSKQKWVADYEHGIKFEVPEEIKNVKNYILKDMAKSWISIEGKFSEKFKWDKDTFIFNMIMWKNQYRFWGSSRNLSKVMARNVEFCLDLPVFSVGFVADANDYEIFKRGPNEARELTRNKNLEKIKYFMS